MGNAIGWYSNQNAQVLPWRTRNKIKVLMLYLDIRNALVSTSLNYRSGDERDHDVKSN